ncbi:DNA polymerase delta, subunit 4-domain-containing protein [Dipodascopsis tothii]|uniref:DNA polymerase delta, subunit 4-domain-containing protein n=1 Tax=Dipodascopsis tothii TaxID=44089 RepID=UPI0034CFC2D9
MAKRKQPGPRSAAAGAGQQARLTDDFRQKKPRPADEGAARAAKTGPAPDGRTAGAAARPAARAAAPGAAPAVAPAVAVPAAPEPEPQTPPAPPPAPLDRHAARYRDYMAAADVRNVAAPVHADGADVVDRVLLHFDLTARFGPTKGLTRLARWRRADAMGLRPPPEVLEILTSAEGDGPALRDGYLAGQP